MIIEVGVKVVNGQRQADIPQEWWDNGWAKEAKQIGDKYQVEFYPGKNPFEIKCIQGRRELKARNLFTSVQADIEAFNNDEATHFFSNLLATWYYDTSIIQQLAQKYNLDLADFFAKAKLQSDRL